MKSKTLPMLCLPLALVVLACKPTSSSDGGKTQAARQDTTNQTAVISAADVQEFWEIVKIFYIDRAQNHNFETEDRFETSFLKKFAVPLTDNDKIKKFAQDMFDFMESGKYNLVLHGITKKPKVLALPPKGMTDRDLQDFLQIVKTEYFKFVAGVQLQNFKAREIRFYAKVQGLPATAMPRQGDLLIIAGDIFEKIETGR
jgi:hypothetical protein